MVNAGQAWRFYMTFKYISCMTQNSCNKFFSVLTHFQFEGWIQKKKKKDEEKIIRLYSDTRGWLKGAADYFGYSAFLSQTHYSAFGKRKDNHLAGAGQRSLTI